MKQNILYSQKIKKYKGKYVAVAHDKVVASGPNAKTAYQLAQKILGKQKVEGLYYSRKNKTC